MICGLNVNTMKRFDQQLHAIQSDGWHINLDQKDLEFIFNVEVTSLMKKYSRNEMFVNNEISRHYE